MQEREEKNENILQEIHLKRHFKQIFPFVVLIADCTKQISKGKRRQSAPS